MPKTAAELADLFRSPSFSYNPSPFAKGVAEKPGSEAKHFPSDRENYNNNPSNNSIYLNARKDLSPVS